MTDRYNGLLNVCKEAGVTSNDVVVKLRRTLRQRRIGHTGTLDPDAVGVLVLVLGDGTKLAEQLTEHDKEYIAVCQLGITTDTQDLSGAVLERRTVSVTGKELRETLRRFLGDQEQIPPMYSALKVGGQRLYELARQGKEIARKPRKIHISAISVLDDAQLEDRGCFTMEVKCSRGTYIRTLCHDIGRRLGCGAAMAHLTRTAVGGFRLEDALTLEQIAERQAAGTLCDAVVPIEEFYRDLDAVIVKEAYRKPLENGNAIALSQTADLSPEKAQDRIARDKLYPDGLRVRLYDENGTFYGVYIYRAKELRFTVDKFFHHKA